ncbi:MAG: GNAT family N-acetyltransferase [Bacteroidota bacterium]
MRFSQISDSEKILFWENQLQEGFINVNIEKYSMDEIKNWILQLQNDIFSEKQLRFIIIHQVSEGIIGSIDLFEYDSKSNSAGVGIIIEEQFRQQGHAFDALSTLLKYSFNTLRLNNLWCYIVAENYNSIKLFLKCGFKIEKQEFNQNFKREVLFLRIKNPNED